MPVLAVAAISARMLAEAAAADGFEVVGLDLFGDLDTRRACTQWWPIGEPSRLHIDADRLLSALAMLAARAAREQSAEVVGWIAGSGFEGRPDLLARGAALLPLIGTPAEAVRRVRDPQLFFDALDAQGIAHPPVLTTAPADANGWLVKDADACGGWHIRRATPHEAVQPPHYVQREVAGTPMSATFIANGSSAVVLGFNQLIVRPVLARPFVFCGAVGPVALAPAVAAAVIAAVRALAATFALRGLGSLDFMLDGDQVQVLEVNPRPPASMALYGGNGHPAASNPIVADHVRACLQGVLPEWPALTGPALTASATVRGTEIVFAPHRLWLSESAAQRLAGNRACHDLPAAALQFDVGDPLCSVSASGTGAEQVLALLDRGREAVYQTLEIHP